MIKKFSEEASINNFGSVQYDRSQKYMTQKDKDQACENIGLGSSIAKNLEEVVFANIPIDSSTLRFSFGDLDYDPTKDTAVASIHNTSDRAGGGTPKGYGGTWKKLNTYYTNIWDYTYSDNTLLNEFDNGGFTYAGLSATRFWDDVEKNPIKIIASDTAGCTNFKRAFQGVLALTEIWELDTSDATNFGFPFQYCKNLRRIPRVLDLSGLTTSGAQSIFAWCSSLEEINQIILPDDNTLSLDLRLFAKGCVSLKSVNEPINCKGVVNIGNGFAGCVSLSHLELENTSRITEFSDIFACCKSLSHEVFDTINTSSATTMTNMFSGLVAQDSSGHRIWEMTVDMDNVHYVPSYDFTKATSIQYMFRSCNISFIDSTKFDSLKTGCKIDGLFYNSKNTEAGMVSTYNTLLSRTPTTYSNCFTDCGINTEAGRTERKYIPTSWGGDMV